jgi:hypothetical protein
MRACSLSFLPGGCGFPTNDVEVLEWQVYCPACLAFSGKVSKIPSRVSTKLLFQNDVVLYGKVGGFFGVS